jgi:hypothetical protein
MPVYVDNARNPFGRMLMCHMVANSIEELLEMADKIGLDRKHFQPWSSPHFDLSQGYRARAIAAGAVEADRRTMVTAMRQYRFRLENDAEEQAAYEQATKASTAGKQRAARRRLRDAVVT